MCCYDKILVNVAAYVIPGSVCVCVCVNRNLFTPHRTQYLFEHKLVYNKQLIIQYAWNEHTSNRTAGLNTMLFETTS